MGSILQLREFQQIAPTLSYGLVLTIATASQWLFLRIDPRPLTALQSAYFNVLVAAVLICYTRAWRTDAGRIPKAWAEVDAAVSKPSSTGDTAESHNDSRLRWCRKCEMPKPPRAHHCKSCQRCIQRMDHHCPWTANCVSYRTMPHFVRFLFFGTLSLFCLQHFLWFRLYALYEKRRLPSYLGPTVTQLVVLFVTTVVNTVTLIGITFLFVRTLWCLAVNTTTIEGWEIERHEALVHRARRAGGVLDAPNGTQVRVTKQEFPYDIGIWSNLVQAFGTRNVLVWAWPFAGSLPIDAGLVYEENGFEDPAVKWPPPDPDRMFQVRRSTDLSQAFTKPMDVESFRARQLQDLDRRSRQAGHDGVRRRAPFPPPRHDPEKRVVELESDEDDNESDDGMKYESISRPLMHITDDRDGEEAWRNEEGERLADFGVDEEVEFYDEEDLPLAELLRLRRQQNCQQPP